MDAFDETEAERATSARPSRPASNGLTKADVGLPGAGAELVDAVLLQEIALLADVIAALSDVETHLRPEQVDDLLGLRHGEPPTAPPT